MPGSRFAVRTRAEIPRAAAAAALLLGVMPVSMRLAPSRSPQWERRWARLATRLIGIDLRISGLASIDESNQYVVAPLHEGFADIVALLHLPLNLKFVARAELSDWRILGRHLDRTAHFVVDPEAPVEAYRRLLRSAPTALADGSSLVVFPQGSILGIESRFSAGAFRLADRLSKPLLPVVLSGSHRVWQHPFSPLVSFGQRIDVRVLPPLKPGSALAAMRALESRMKAAALDSVASPRRFVPERDGWWDGYHYDIDPSFPELAARVKRHRLAARPTAA